MAEKKAAVRLETFRCIVSLEGEKKKFITLKREDFEDVSWDALLREAKRNAKQPGLGYDVAALVCPTTRGGCGKIRVLALQDRVDEGVQRVGLTCISCGKRYRLEGPEGGKLEFKKKPKKTKT